MDDPHANPVLTLESVHAIEKDRALFSQLSLALEPGQSLALVSKEPLAATQCLQIALGEQNCDKGKVRLFRSAPAKLPPETWRKVGALSLRSGFLPALSLGQNLRLRTKALAPNGGWPQMQEAALAMFDLHRLANTPVAKLSVGEQKCAALARCLMHEPKLLLLDQPFNHLTRDQSRYLIKKLQRLQAKGTALLIASQRFRYLEQLTSDALWLKKNCERVSLHCHKLEGELSIHDAP